MYAFAINIVDSSIDSKICKTETATSGGEGKCTKASSGTEGDKKLSVAFAGAHATSNEKVDAHTSKTIATETSAIKRKRGWGKCMYTNPNAYMYAFAINIVDSSIDSKFCKQGQNKDEDTAGKCRGAATGESTEDKKLSKAFDGAHAMSTEKIDGHCIKRCKRA